MSKIKAFFKDEQGLETVEYAVMTALIIAGVIIAITALAVAVSNRFNDTANTVDTAPAT